jgi:hypothetical protein
MIEMYEHEKHYSMMRRWLAAHDLVIPEKQYFSPIGLVVNNKAIGFLSLSDSNKGYLEDFAAEPKCDPMTRDGSLRVLTDALTEIAAKKGVKLLIALTCLATMKQRFYDMEFRRLPDSYTMYTKFLNQGA